jgi:hypothetical protein
MHIGASNAASPPDPKKDGHTREGIERCAALAFVSVQWQDRLGSSSDFRHTVHAVQDARTGYLFYYHDFANTIKVPMAYRSYPIAGTGHRVHEPDLIDDRPKPAK